MDLDVLAKIVAIVGAIVAGVYALFRGAILLGAWVSRRTQEGENWSAQERRIGALTDRVQGVITSLEQKIDAHAHDDSRRFEVISDQLTDIKYSLGKIEGKLEIEE